MSRSSKTQEPVNQEFRTEILVFIAYMSVTLYSCMCSYLVRLEVWILDWTFLYFHALCKNSPVALAMWLVQKSNVLSHILYESHHNKTR